MVVVDLIVDVAILGVVDVVVVEILDVVVVVVLAPAAAATSETVPLYGEDVKGNFHFNIGAAYSEVLTHPVLAAREAGQTTFFQLTLGLSDPANQPKRKLHPAWSATGRPLH